MINEVPINNCPRCQSDLYHLHSSPELEISEILCTDCGFGFQAPVPEDDIILMWNVIEETRL